MKRILGILFAIIVLVSCNSQKKIYSDFDISYSKSGGLATIYENLLIKGTDAHYSFEGQGKKIKQNFKVSYEDLKKLENIISENNFRRIEEDHKKIYDFISTSINIRQGKNSGSKTDASGIMPKYRSQWTNVTNAFQEIINTNVKKQ